MSRSAPNTKKRGKVEDSISDTGSRGSPQCLSSQAAGSFVSPNQPKGLPGRLVKLWAQQDEVTCYKWHVHWICFLCALLLQLQPRQCLTTSTQKTTWTQDPSMYEKMVSCTWSIWPWMVSGVACRSQGLSDCFPKASLWSFV